MKVELVAIDRVIPYARNPRKNEAAIAKVAASIKEYGFRQPIVVDAEMIIIAGHTRLQAARQLSLKQVPVHIAEGLTPAQIKAYRLADNRTHEDAEWDDDLLAIELGELAGEGFDLSLTGFEEVEWEKLLAEDTPEESAEGEDDAPEIQEVAISRSGDLWLLGNHRLLCGDSTNEEDVRRLFEGQKAKLFSTDPPYLVDYTGADRPGGLGKDWSDKYNEVDIKDADSFFTSVFSLAKKMLKPNAAWYCWHAHKRASQIESIWEKLGVLNHQQIIWVKPAAVHSYSYYPWQHEPCLMGWQKGHKPKHDGSNSHSITSVWELDWEGKARVGKAEHPTQKPVEVFAIPMRKHTKEGDICYEPFSGSGSQIIAGEKCHRHIYAMEISPPFVDAAIRRWEKYTGKQAILAGETEKTFADVLEERQAASSD